MALQKAIFSSKISFPIRYTSGAETAKATAPIKIAGVKDLKIIDNHDIAEKMSAQNLEDIKQKDWPVIVKKIDEVYKSIL